MNHNELVAWGGVSEDADPARNDQATLFDMGWIKQTSRQSNRLDD